MATKESGYRPSRFIDAAKRGDEGAVQAALENKEKPIDVNKTDSLGETALHWASRAGWYGTMKLLLEGKANPNIQDKVFLQLTLAWRDSPPQGCFQE